MSKKAKKHTPALRGRKRFAYLGYMGCQCIAQQKGVYTLINRLDAPWRRAELNRRVAFIFPRLIASQQKLFKLIRSKLSRAEICCRLGITKSTLSREEDRLIKKVEKLSEKYTTDPPKSAY